MAGGLLIAAVIWALAWAGARFALGGWFLRHERALRQSIAARHPNPDWARMSPLERATQRPFNDQGAAVFSAAHEALTHRFNQGRALLTALGLLGLVALVVLARLAV